MSEDQVFRAKREKLSKSLQRAALDLLGHMGAASALVPIEGTTPTVYVVIGEAGAAERLLSTVTQPPAGTH